MQRKFMGVPSTFGRHCRPIGLGGGEKGFCPPKLSGALQTSKQSYVYRMLMKFLLMYIFLY